MDIVAVPRGLKRTMQALALCLPLAALEAIIAKRAPWWRLPYRQIGMACVPVFVVYITAAILILRGKRLGYFLVIGAFSVWLAVSAVFSLYLHHSELIMFTVILGALLYAFQSWLRVEMGRSFVDPKMKWYEGLPKPIPGLNCDVLSGSDSEHYRVGRLDREGVFVFRDNSRSGARSGRIKVSELSELVLSYRDRRISCKGLAIRIDNRMGAQSGIGFQFRDLKPDARKTLGDLVEALKGEGYVS